MAPACTRYDNHLNSNRSSSVRASYQYKLSDFAIGTSDTNFVFVLFYCYQFF